MKAQGQPGRCNRPIKGRRRASLLKTIPIGFRSMAKLRQFAYLDSKGDGHERFMGTVQKL
jgi:hypothetical protein